MSLEIECGKLDAVLESIFRIPVDAEKLEKWVNGGEYETVMLGGKQVPSLRNLVRQIDERESQAAEAEINEAKAEIGALAAKIRAKIDELKAMTATAETLSPDEPATAYYNAETGEFQFGIPKGQQGIQGEQGLAPAIDVIYGGDPAEPTLDIIYGGDPSLSEQENRTIVRQVNRIGTSAAWVAANPILEDGEQGFERTPDGKLMWKIGDGVTPWNDLDYPPILIDTIYRFRGSVATIDNLPSGAAEGDVYNVVETGANYAWTGEDWDNLGVVQQIDATPLQGSGNPVSSGGVYDALEDHQAQIEGLEETVSAHGEAITGLQDDVTGLQELLPVPVYTGATDTAPGVAGLVPPATPEEKDFVLHGDGTYGPVSGVVDIATTETAGISKPDGNSIIIDEDGTLHSRSIPFENGIDRFELWLEKSSGAWPESSKPSGFTTIDAVVYKLGNSEFNVKEIGKHFCHAEDEYIIFDEDGLYTVDWLIQLACSTSYTSWNGVRGFLNLYEADGSYLNDGILTYYAESKTQGNIISGLGWLQGAATMYIKSGQKLTLSQMHTATKEAGISTHRIQVYISKLPVTNEYQVQNPIINIYFLGSFTTQIQVVGQFYDMPIGPILQSGSGPSGYPEKIVAGINTDSKSLDILEDGYYNITAEFCVNINTDAIYESDIIVRIDGTDVTYATGTLKLGGTSLNPDVLNLSTNRYLRKGDKIKISAAFPLAISYSINYISIIVTKLPSVVQNTTTSYAQIYAFANPGVIQASGGNNLTSITVNLGRKTGNTKNYFEVTSEGYIKILKDGYYGLQCDLVLVATDASNGKDIRFGIGSVSPTRNSILVGQITANTAYGNGDYSNAFGIYPIKAGTLLDSFITVWSDQSPSIPIHVYAVNVLITHLWSSTSSGAADVSVDNITITKDENNVLSALPGGMIDNDSLVLNEEGKITSRSIPFDSGSLIVISAIGDTTTDFPHSDVIVNNIRTIIPTISTSSFSKTQTGKSFGYPDGEDFVFSEAGMYDVSVIWSYKPAPEGNATDIDLGVRIEIKRPTDTAWNLLTTQTKNVDNKSFIVETASLGAVDIVKAGTRIRFVTQVPAALTTAAGVNVAGFTARIAKLPATNEYQVSNPSLRTYFRENFTGPGNADGELHMFALDQVEQSSMKYGDDTSQLGTGGYVEILKDGLYHISAEVAVNYGSNVAGELDFKYATMLVRDGTASIITAATLHILPSTPNPDSVHLAGEIVLKAGDRLALAVATQRAGGIINPYAVMQVMRYPDVTDNVQQGGCSEPLGQIRYSVSPGVVSVAGVADVPSGHTLLAGQTSKKYGDADKYFGITGDGKLKILKSGFYTFDLQIYVIANSESNGKDIRFGLAIEGTSIFDYLSGQITPNIAEGNSDLSTVSYSGYIDAGTEFIFFVKVSGSLAHSINVNIANINADILYLGNGTGTCEAEPAKIKVLPNGSSMNSITMPGKYYCAGWSDAPVGLLASGTLEVAVTENNASIQQTFEEYGYIYKRGGAVSDLATLVWLPMGAPRPTGTSGKMGEWKKIDNNSSGASITIPEGGVWAYILHGYAPSYQYGGLAGHAAGVVAGGTVVTLQSTHTISGVYGIAWRIA